MKLWPILAAGTAWATALSGHAPSADIVVVIGGDTNGYLSPCGCTKPMAGGIRKRISLIKNLTAGRQSLILENGGLVAGQSRQDALKAEMMAQCLKVARTDAITFGYSEARFGKGMLASLSQLSGGRLVNTAFREPERSDLRPWVEKGPFLVGALDTRAALVAGLVREEPITAEAAVRRLVEEALASGKTPILMLQGSREESTEIAKAHPQLGLIVYRSDGTPAEAERIGDTWLASPGGNGLYVIVMSYRNRGFLNCRALRVEASTKDDPDCARLFRDYLSRTNEEKLADKVPRFAGAAYAGSKACAGCHSRAYSIWARSSHAVALKSLEKEGQGRDPECLPCHVAGLASKAGFRSRSATPELANVGCESCHGPSANHVKQPKRHKPSGASEACVTCHRSEHSPGFVFPKFWKTIEHK
jgi:hypothetical protein